MLVVLLLIPEVGFVPSNDLGNGDGRLFTNNPLAACGLALARIPLDLEPLGGSLTKESDVSLPGRINLEVVRRESVLVVVEVRGDLVAETTFLVLGRVTLTLFLKSSFLRLCSFLTSIFFSSSFLSDLPKKSRRERDF